MPGHLRHAAIMWKIRKVHLAHDEIHLVAPFDPVGPRRLRYDVVIVLVENNVFHGRSFAGVVATAGAPTSCSYTAT